MVGILALALAVGGTMAARDTLVEVRPGDRLILEGFSGEVFVGSWERSVMSLGVEAEGTASFRIQRSGDRLELRVADRGGRSRAKELRVLVPPWMNLEIAGRDMDAVVEGVEGEVVLRNLEGDLVLRKLGGAVRATSVEGGIEARGLTGTARLRTGSDDLRVEGSSGTLELETVDGDVELAGVESSRVTVRTTDGDIDFSGRLPAGGEFSFHSHSGDITLRLAPPVNLEVSVLAYEGEFSSDFPVRARGFRTGEGFQFTIGEGGGRMVLEAFDGDIRILNMREPVGDGARARLTREPQESIARIP